MTGFDNRAERSPRVSILHDRIAACRIWLSGILLAVSITGCSTPGGSTVEVQVPVPVYVRCGAKIPPKPEQCVYQEDRVAWLRCALIERERLKAYAADLAAQLRACSE